MKRKKIIILIVALVIAIALIALLIKHETSGGFKPPAAVVTVTTVKLAKMPTQIYALSTLISSNVANIASEINGIIESIHFNEGMLATQGNILVKLNDDTQAADLDKAKAKEALTELDFNRNNSLSVKGAVSKQELDKANADMKVAQASTAAAAAELSKTEIKAPFTGYLGERLVSVGEYIVSGQSLVNIVDKRQLKLQFAVPERYLPQLKIGAPVSFTTEAFPREIFTGSISFISPSVDTGTRTLLIEAFFDNADERLSPGLSGQATLLLGINDNAMRIPEEAILPTITGYQVYRVVDGHAQLVPIQIGTRSEGFVHILSGIAAGDVVVLRGQQTLRDGAPVEIVTGG